MAWPIFLSRGTNILLGGANDHGGLVTQPTLYHEGRSPNQHEGSVTQQTLFYGGS